jgi:hypothetical protein
VNARMASRPEAMNAYPANSTTSARNVMFGQARAMIPIAAARTPRTISDVLSDFSMTSVPFPCSPVPGCRGLGAPRGQP